MSEPNYEILPPEDRALVPAKPVADIAPIHELIIGGFGNDARLRGQLIPIRFNLEQDSNARIERSQFRARSDLMIGMDEVRIHIEAVFVPIAGYTSPEFCGVDHLPCLKAILPLYQWVIADVSFEDRVERSPLDMNSFRRVDYVCLDQFVSVTFQGCALP